MPNNDADRPLGANKSKPGTNKPKPGTNKSKPGRDVTPKRRKDRDDESFIERILRDPRYDD